MTKKELIEELKDCPDDMSVTFESGEIVGCRVVIVDYDEVIELVRE